MFYIGDNYAIIYGVVFIVFLTAVLLCGVVRAHVVYKMSNRYLEEIKEVIEELKEIVYIHIIEEEDIMSNKVENLTLSTLLTQEPTEAEYEEVLDILEKLAKDTFKDFNFLIARSPDETEQANFLQLVSNWHDAPELHKEVFKKAVAYGLDTKELQKKFAERVAKGFVVPLGDDIEVITDDNSPQPPTGVSPVNSGLEGGEISFIVSFIHKDNLDEWTKNIFPQKQDEKVNE